MNQTLSPDGRYVRKVRIGKGSFKTVYKAFDEVECMNVAWNEVTGEGAEESEIEMLSTLSHPNILRVMAMWTQDKGLPTARRVFITEFCSSGSIRQFLKESSSKKVSPHGAKNWGRQMLRGLAYLHSRSVIHRDLKCDNIFINGQSGVIKIGDFGMARFMQRSVVGSVIGTPEFMAPEIYDEAYTNKVDIYAFGMCLLEMVTGKYPYSECENRGQVFRKVCQGQMPRGVLELSLEEPDVREVKEIVLKCLGPPGLRPTAAELLDHPFFVVQAMQPEDASEPNAAGVTIMAKNVRTIQAGRAGMNPAKEPLEGESQQMSPVQPSNATSCSSSEAPVQLHEAEAVQPHEAVPSHEAMDSQGSAALANAGAPVRAARMKDQDQAFEDAVRGMEMMSEFRGNADMWGAVEDIRSRAYEQREQITRTASAAIPPRVDTSPNDDAEASTKTPRDANPASQSDLQDMLNRHELLMDKINKMAMS